MIACFDVFYQDNVARAAAVVIDDWGDTFPVNKYVKELNGFDEYEPGKFYQRELQPLLILIEQISEPISRFVIDAYCHLSVDQEPGLGAHLARHLPDDSVVIGVAKSRFRDTRHAFELYRGQSERPLFITATSIDYSDAARKIATMEGEHRMPTILKEVDRLSRDGFDAAT